LAGSTKQKKHGAILYYLVKKKLAVLKNPFNLRVNPGHFSCTYNNLRDMEDGGTAGGIYVRYLKSRNTTMRNHTSEC
jgi:hypothetical protein